VYKDDQSFTEMSKNVLDPDLIPEVTRMTNPEVGTFLQEHVIKGTPIDHEKYLKRAGVHNTVVKQPTPVIFLA
jgi:hypothetical protein